jgi:zinc transporter ZupT
MNAAGAKLLIALAIFLISFLSSAAPLKVINVDDRFFSVGNLLASGVLLAGGLVHQLPDSMANLRGVTDFPLAAFLAGFTFCLFLILEEYIHAQFDDSFGEGLHHDDHSHAAEAAAAIEDNHGDGRTSAIYSNYYSDQGNCKSVSVTLSSTNGKASRRQQRAGEIPDGGCNEVSSLLRPSGRSCLQERAVVSIRKSTRPSMLETFRNDTFELDHPIHHHDDHLAEHMHGSLLAAIILLLALSVHSIFEGLAIGVAQDMSQVLSTTAAVLAHKAFAGYALGSSMVASQMKEGHFLVLCFVFAWCSVAGVFVGMLFEQFGGTDDSTSTGVIQAMVSGTFLYVSIVEIGMKEIMMHREVATGTTKAGDNLLSTKTLQFLKLGAFLVGYTMMSALAIWV